MFVTLGKVSGWGPNIYVFSVDRKYNEPHSSFSLFGPLEYQSYLSTSPSLGQYSHNNLFRESYNSPNTKSIVPMMATASASRCPLLKASSPLK